MNYAEPTAPTLSVPRFARGMEEFRLRAVVAIPVSNEAERIAACLEALGSQTGMPPGSFGVVLFLNNCTDGTDQIIAALAPRLSCPLRLLRQDCPDASAGWARREAMEAAATWLGESGAEDGVLLTTDADSRVGHDWVFRNLAAVAGGADAVAGRIVLDAVESAMLPTGLHERGRLEGEYETLLVELEARLDPEEHDPWPRHSTASGASLAVRLDAFRRIGGLPRIALGEDRAMVAALQAHDARVRHDPDILVITSGRLDGRAAGGVADTMKLRSELPESLCDSRLEPTARAALRFFWRRRIRRLHADRRMGMIESWAPALDIGRDDAMAISRLPWAGQAIADIERLSPRLICRLLRPSELPRQICLARMLLRLLQSPVTAWLEQATSQPRYDPTELATELAADNVIQGMTS